MKKELNNFGSSAEEALYNLQNAFPSIIFAIIVFLAGLFIIKQATRIVTRFLNEKSKNSIVTDFLVNIVSFVLTLLLIVVCLGILGFKDITNKILAGTALTTFIIGFALKDIGENFLAGILMAFRRPFKIGDLIEVEGMRGRVKKMSLRETNIKTLDGKDVFIPNSIILKNPLENFTYNQLLRSDFTLNVSFSNDVEKLMKDILDIINSFEEVEKEPKSTIYIQDIDGEKIKIRGAYWFKTTDVTAPGNSLKSAVLFKIVQYLKDNEVILKENKEDTGAAAKAEKTPKE